MKKKFYTSISSSNYLSYTKQKCCSDRMTKKYYIDLIGQACERWVNAFLSCLQVKDPKKTKFPLNSVKSSEFNEVVQIDHQKICMNDSRYNQILVIIEHFTKLAESVPYQTASAEETCNHLITL